MSFVAIARGATQLTVDVPPKIVSRFDEGGPERAPALTISGEAVVVEWPAAANPAVLKLRWEYLTAAQAALLASLIDGEGPVNVARYPSATPAAYMFGPRKEQKIASFLHPEGYPDTLADGSAQLDERKAVSAELTLYRA